MTPFDPANAPPGYRAVPNPVRHVCRLPDGTPCVMFRPGRSCLVTQCGSPESLWCASAFGHSCIGGHRPDKTDAVFLKDAYGNEEDA